MTPTRFVVTVRHGRGTLARLAATLNPHPVTGFAYELDADDTAIVRVTVAGTAWDAERVRARLSRGVDVLDVAGDSGAPRQEPYA
jgi:hypothetical protein